MKDTNLVLGLGLIIGVILLILGVILLIINKKRENNKYNKIIGR